MSYFKSLEVRVDLQNAGSTTQAIDHIVAQLPSGSKFLGSCATPSSVYLFFDVQGHAPNTPATPPSTP